MHRAGVVLASLLLLATVAVGQSAAPPRIVLIAGALDDHPRGTHEYEESVRLLAHILRTEVPDVQVETYLSEWPGDPRTLDSADSIVLISAGSDRRREDHPLLVGDRLDQVGAQMERGCGLVLVHWSTFAPREGAGERLLEWVGGHFDYESGPPPRHWASNIKVVKSRPRVATPEHPIARGLSDFGLREEWYYDIRFRPDDPRLVPILATEIEGEEGDHVVAWAVERADGGRGFATTGGHFFDNFFVPGFRRMLANAIVWTARAEVPDQGVEGSSGDRIRALILTGHNHPAHDWRATTQALRESLEADPRYVVTVTEDIEDLARVDLSAHDVLVQNYCNWERAGLSDDAKAAFTSFLSGGGGLVLVHFANGAFHASLPGATASDWPEYRAICRRVWDHGGASGHDPYGTFTVQRTETGHPITAGLKRFETVDELYFRQAGEVPIEPLLVARSKVTRGEEPLAWAHAYGEGRVFQTVLGHSAASLRIPEVARIVRRGATWSARREQLEVPRNDTGTPALDPDYVPDPAFTPTGAFVGDEPTDQEAESDWVDDRFQDMDTGPFLFGSFDTPGIPGSRRTARGLAIRLGDDGRGVVLFDTEHLRVVGVWPEGRVVHSPVRFGLLRAPRIEGAPKPAASALDTKPGLGRFDAVTVDGRDALLWYTLEDLNMLVFERFRFAPDGSRAVVREISLTRPIQWGPDWQPGPGPIDRSAIEEAFTFEDGEGIVVAPPNMTAAYGTPRDDLGAPTNLLDERIDDSNRWGEPISVRGTLGATGGAFVVDTIPLPFENDGNALLFTSGIDFLPGGDAAVCTAHGDVWIVSGLDETLEEVTWRRFATGLYQPLGLKVTGAARGQVFVTCRDRITQLEVRDAGGEAYLYWSFANGLEVAGHDHHYAMGLETDAQGRFYFQKSGDRSTRHGGTLVRVPKHGRGIEVFAEGFRHVNGLAIGPSGLVTNADNQGEWIPSTRLNAVRQGGFYGYAPGYHGEGEPPEPEPPLCWIPHAVDNSAGGQAWVPEGRWGPLAGSLLHTSFGRCALFHVPFERDGTDEDARYQGGVVRLPLKFRSGAMRARFRPQDGHLYVVGLDGWQTEAVEDGCLQRVRYTGKPLRMLTALAVHANGLLLTFSEPLSEAGVAPEAFAIQRWNYRYARTYGSKDWSVSDPEREGRDAVEVDGVRLTEDRRSVFLAIDDLAPVMQMRVAYDLRDATGSALEGEVHHTIHWLGPTWSPGGAQDR